MQIVRTLLASLLSTGVLLSAAFSAAAEKDRASALECPRKFSDEQIRQILIEKLPIRGEGGMNVIYQDCKYWVLMWPPGHPPDSDSSIELDHTGNLPPEVVKYGWHGDEKHDVSLRNAPAPPYPPRALAAKITGSVVVRATVTPASLHGDATTGKVEGFITDVHIVRVSPPTATALTDGLTDTLRRWVFNPRMRYGTALPRDVMLRFRFSIDGKNAASGEKIDVPEDVDALDTFEING